MNILENQNGPGLPMSHMIYFTLSDSSPELFKLFIDACIKYLSGYKDQTHFSIGYRVTEINRDVSAKNYEIAVNMIFKNFNAYLKYSAHRRHEKFITQTAGMSTTRLVYDSFIVYNQENTIEK